MNKRNHPEEKPAKRARVEDELYVITLFTFLGDEMFTFFIKKSKLSEQDLAMLKRATRGDWQPLEPEDVLGVTEDDFVYRCMNGTKEQYLANDGKSDDQLDEEMAALREKYRSKYRKALLKRYPHRAEENSVLDCYDTDEHCYGAAYHYFEEVFRQKHAMHCVRIFGGSEEIKDTTGETLNGATYDRQLSQTIPRFISTPFQVNKPFSRFICLNFSNGGCA